MQAEDAPEEQLLNKCEGVVNELYAQCTENAPNFGVSRECFNNSLRKTVRKYLFPDNSAAITGDEINSFLREIQINDLFMALACGGGSERAWWSLTDSIAPI